jgi:hypothetical protein
MVRDGTRRAQIVGGIGRAVAKRLAQDGFTVVVSYMNAAEAEAVVAELKGIGGNAVAVPADVSSPPTRLMDISRSVLYLGLADSKENKRAGRVGCTSVENPSKLLILCTWGFNFKCATSGSKHLETARK